MGERDAFGREKSENTLADMGWSSGSSPQISAEPVPAVERPATPPSAMEAGAATTVTDAFRSSGLPRVQRRRVRPGRFIGLVIVLAIAGAGFLAVGSVVETGREALDDFQGAVRDATVNVAPTPAAPPPTGVEGGSLLRPAALKAALDKMPAGSIVSLRVAPERIDAQVIVDGQMHVVQVTSSGEVSDVGTPASVPELAKLRVDAAAPSRIARTAARRAGRDPSAVDYLVLMNLGGKREWQLFFKDDGLHYSASANGRKVRRVG